MAAVIKKNTDSSTATPIIQEHQNCSGCPQYLSPQSGSTSGQPSEVQLLVQCLTQMGEMQLEINSLKAGQGKSTGFYQSLTKLSNVSRAVIWILMIIPMLQLVACAAIVYYLGIQEELSSLLTWVLGGVSFLSVAEMIIMPIKFAVMENRMSEIERKLSEKQDTN
ncbi:MAG: hypothetical protein J6B70_03000 [Oscillospiraceae bacterium]|nr:hypothetical protein [Oscillospiraceae bacterium]